MAQNETPQRKSFGEKLTSFPRLWLYGLLMLCTSIPLFVTVVIPTKPSKPTIDLFAALMSLPDGSTIIVQSDWTMSTRGESAGAMEALLRILMRKNIRFALMSVADPQAPQVAKNTIRRINAERKLKGQKEWVQWEDWVSLGYFPNAEGIGNAMANNLRTAWGGKKDMQPGAGMTDVFQSPVLKNVRRIEDVPMMIDIHASDTLNRLIERVGKRTRLASMCTGVMGPETIPYHTSGQIVGVSVGLNGVVEMETMMENGIHPTGEGGAVEAAGKPAIPGFKGETNLARGMNYYLSLHVALTLMILAVVIGNIGMFLSRRRTEA
jgi:hypothetical protein